MKKFHLYWALTKSMQTSLLLSTGIAGFITSRCPVIHFPMMLGFATSLYLAIAGSTIINMWYDRDIDSFMTRTCSRPLVAGTITPGNTIRLGLVLSLLGVCMAAGMNLLYGLVVSAGLFFDVIVYTIWLKRRTPWSIIWGGLAGGMPILAGRTLGIGQIDWIGILLAMAVLFWIPTHIMTFNIRYMADYQRAGIPTFPSKFGLAITRLIIAFSSIFVTGAIGLASYYLSLSWGFMRLLAVLAAGLIGIAIGSLTQPSDSLNFGLFKYASIYLLSAMLILILGTI